MNTVPDRTSWLQTAVIAGVAVVNLAWGEVLPVAHGFGWDGQTYAAMTRSFSAAVDDGESVYRLQRLIPSLLISMVMRTLHISRNDAHVLAAFRIYNAVILVFSAYVWSRATRYLRLPQWTRWFSFVAMFGSYAFLKQFFYTPVSTDQSAFFLGILLLHAWLRRAKFEIGAIAIAGLFVWPTVAPMAVLLVAFPRSLRGTQRLDWPALRWLPIMAALAFSADAFYACYKLQLLPLYGAAPPVHAFLPLSIAAASAYLVMGYASCYNMG